MIENQGTDGWELMNPNKNLPLDCIIGGYEESDNYKGPLHIGRKTIDNELVIGKVIDAWKSGYFPKDGGEHWSDSYEVLCGVSAIWTTNVEDKKLIKGGLAGNNEPFYICRANFNSQTIPGKFFKPTGCCYVASYGKEHCVNDFSLLSFLL
jgi:hypothetical protein